MIRPGAARILLVKYNESNLTRSHNPIDLPDHMHIMSPIEKELDELELNDDLIQSSNYYTLSEMNELKKTENDIAVFHTNISSLA